MGSGRASEVGGGDGAVDMPGDLPPGGADRGGGGDRLVVRGEGIQDLVVDAAVDQGEGEPVGGQPVGIGPGDPFDEPVAA